ncbi:hypothetical protein Pla86_08120 [Planctomycetes bacterium Pla86]|uniref:Lipase (Class 3) n=1 Tax=Engelhardtia mirabilis TaxID=2528011 RepID=A0A518BFI7_9BACT|nr:hypothetical protein Pla133_08130 [Planctomycetes bacterium Pla133]QDV00073.1 hypothetical protein Pla86_08120 [Planctomycetes bacterium Pla86]
MPSLCELTKLAASAYTDRRTVGRWRRVRDFGRPRDAFRAGLWVRADGAGGVLSVRGTANLASAMEDLKLLLGREPGAWRRGRGAVAASHALVGRRLLLTGHSLGGAFASALAREAHLRAVTFNAPGMARALGISPGPSGSGTILNLCVGDDWIRLLSGPGLGLDLSLGPGDAPLPTGLRGLATAFVQRRRPGEGITAFIATSIARHRLGAFPWQAAGSSAASATAQLQFSQSRFLSSRSRSTSARSNWWPRRASASR